MSLVQVPFNAEPPRSALTSSYVTPVDFFYKRNHGPIPIVDDIERLHFLSEFLLSTYKTFKVFDVKQC
jgi:sulfite oxidase